MTERITYKLREWVEVDKLNWRFLSANPRAIHLLEQYPDKIDTYRLCTNPNPDAIPLIEKNLYKLDNTDWVALCENPNAISIIEREVIGRNDTPSIWAVISSNPNAVGILKRHPDKIHYRGLCNNTHPDAIDLLEQHYDKIWWSTLSANPSAIRLIERRLSEPFIPEIHSLDFRVELPSVNVNWEMLSMNPNAIHLLKQNPDKVSLRGLCLNPNIMQILIGNDDLFKKIDNLDRVGDNMWLQICKNARKGLIQFLEEHPDKLSWRGLSENPIAIDLIEACEDKSKLDYRLLSMNPEIFTV